MTPKEADYFMQLPALRGVRFQHEEHLELILATALEPKLEVLPLWTCCGVEDLEIENRRLEDITVRGVLGETIYGDMVVEFNVCS